MAETLFLDIPEGQWTNISDTFGRNAVVTNVGEHRLTWLKRVDDPGVNLKDGHRLRDDNPFEYVLDNGESIWMRAAHYGGRIAATPDLAIGSFKSAVNVHDADVHDVPINELFHQHTGIATTLAVAASAGDTSITVVDGSLFNNEDTFQIDEGLVVETTLPVIKAGGTTNTFTLDRPLNNDFGIGASVEKVVTNMAVDGTLLAPVAFRLIPDVGQEWHVISITLSMTHNSGSDPSLFGDLAQLANGLILRAFNGQTGKYRTFDLWKTNDQISLTFGSILYQPKVGGGDFGTFATASIKFKSGAVPKISADNGDYLEGLVQDPLAGLLSLFMKAQGHIEGI